MNWKVIMLKEEKEMATHSSTLAWKLPWMKEPGRLQSMGLQRVRHDWATSLSFYNSFWRREWQPSPVFLPGESHGWRGLVGCSLWGRKESDMTKQLTHTHIHTHTHTHTNQFPIDSNGKPSHKLLGTPWSWTHPTWCMSVSNALCPSLSPSPRLDPSTPL